MARLSGITDVPEESPICLGCHATAAETEPWERDADFRIEDGVQCEKCHGPGSEYIDVMGDAEASKRAGLKRFTKRDCEVCHYVKGSHVAVHNKPKIDVDEAWERLSHVIPEGGVAAPTTASLAGRPEPGGEDGGEPRYTGTHACAECHRGPMMGYQYSRWRLSPHARAYAALALPAAKEIAGEMGVADDPQTAPACLSCHVTGGGAAVAGPRRLLALGGRGLRVLPRSRERVQPRGDHARPGGVPKGWPRVARREDLRALPREGARQALRPRERPGRDRAPRSTSRGPPGGRRQRRTRGDGGRWRDGPRPGPRRGGTVQAAAALARRSEGGGPGLPPGRVQDAGEPGVPARRPGDLGRLRVLGQRRGGRRGLAREGGRDPGGRPPPRRGLRSGREPRLRQQPTRRRRLRDRRGVAQGDRPDPRRGRAPRAR